MQRYTFYRDVSVCGCSCNMDLDDGGEYINYDDLPAMIEEISVYIETIGRGKCVTHESAKALADDIRYLFRNHKEAT